MALSKNIQYLIIVMALLIHGNSAIASSNRKSDLRTFGDYMQVVNPIIAASLASQEKGFGHFGFIYAQTFVSMHSIKYIGKSAKWNISKRPYINNKKDRYEGMPSGHTASAWSAAAYVRTFSNDYQYISIPLYITAAVTGYSRIKAKEHTTSQVIVGAVLSEIITYINSRLDWSNEYRSTNFYFGGDELTASFKFNL
ncbi:MAG: phosphatase PAP2 family protein [Rickettsiales bacterium]|nr:MAG: phosphatase PAP2 family protein [Rickettsiales bacterium]